MNKEKQIPFILWAIFTILVVSMCSCSVQNEFIKAEEQLCTPDHVAYEIVYVTETRIYLKDYPGDYIFKSRKDTTDYKIGGLILDPIQYYSRY